MAFIDNQPLRKSIEKFAKFPIATSFDKGEPRLLVISVDAAEGTTVTFDSYERSKEKEKQNMVILYSKNLLL